MSDIEDTANQDTVPDEVSVLREKLQLMQQIQALQLQLNPPAGPSHRQPTMATVKGAQYLKIYFLENST